MTEETAEGMRSVSDINSLDDCPGCGSDNVGVQKIADAKSIICEPPVWLRLYIEALMLLNSRSPVAEMRYGIALSKRAWARDVRGWKWTRLAQELVLDALTRCVPLSRRNILAEGFPCVYLDRYEQQTSSRDIQICDARRELPRMLFTRDLMRLLQPRLAEGYMRYPAFYVGVSEAFDKEVFWVPAAGELKEVAELDEDAQGCAGLVAYVEPGPELRIMRIELRDALGAVRVVDDRAGD